MINKQLKLRKLPPRARKIEKIPPRVPQESPQPEEVAKTDSKDRGFGLPKAPKIEPKSWKKGTKKACIF